MTEAMAAEFDTVAEWTAEVAADLGTAYHIPAGCRGSGTPAALDWLVGNLDPAPGEAFLDCGAGVGGPAAYAVQQRAVRPVLVEPEAGACRAARDLFGYPVLRAVASALPIADESFSAAWSLGVLCTMRDQLSLLTEMGRVVRPSGHIGMLAFVARELAPDEQPKGNNFPIRQSICCRIWWSGLDCGLRRGAAPQICRRLHRTGDIASISSTASCGAGTQGSRRGKWPNSKLN